MAAQVQVREFDADEYLAREAGKDLLRFTTAGSVDDGKSTLIGRLLYDSRNVYEDQVRAIAKTSAARGAGLDLSLLTDGLRAEREQGITIDVAYRYFATARRKFIIADTPGHEQYTRNMATGASTADLAIILVDARHGVQPQSLRHAYIATLLGIPRMVVAVNKMDLVGYAEPVFAAIRDEFHAVLARLRAPEAYFVPISALAGENVVRRGRAMPWFDGPSLLEHLETVKTATGDGSGAAPFRLPVQYVIRAAGFRGYAGQIASGAVGPGDEILVLPSGRRTRVRSIESFDGALARAYAPMAVTLTLADQLDVGRGDLLVNPDNNDQPHTARRFEADVVWLDGRPLDPARPYLLKHAARTVPARIAGIAHRVDIRTLEPVPAAALSANEIGLVGLETAQPISFDPYRQNRATGAAILIDPETNATAGALMIRRAAEPRLSEWLPVTAVERNARFGHAGFVVWLGGREKVARLVERALFDRGGLPLVLAAPGGALAEELASAGAVVLACGERAPRMDLPQDDLQAARAVLRLIGHRHALPEWIGGEGI